MAGCATLALLVMQRKGHGASEEGEPTGPTAYTVSGQQQMEEEEEEEDYQEAFPYPYLSITVFLGLFPHYVASLGS